MDTVNLNMALVFSPDSYSETDGNNYPIITVFLGFEVL